MSVLVVCRDRQPPEEGIADTFKRNASRSSRVFEENVVQRKVRTLTLLDDSGGAVMVHDMEEDTPILVSALGREV